MSGFIPHSSRRFAGVIPAGAALLLMLSILIQGTSVVMAQDAISNAELEKIGRRIWQNECSGSVEGLTSWNSGEEFPSLGIGHFIWYPTGKTGPFDETFPQLVVWLKKSGASVPEWLLEAKGCPWADRASFLKDRESPRMKELRELLASTILDQTRFIVKRQDVAAEKLLANAGEASARVKANINLLRQSAAGNFALIDYVNFKGEGLKTTERYNGEGWGLLQVLSTMEATDAGKAPRAFADAAKAVLSRRVSNSPAERNEKQWLQGWINRCETYAN